MSDSVKTWEITGIFTEEAPETFTEATAPDWLAKGGIKNSTMDNRWFWEKHVLTMEVNEILKTDFRILRRTV